MIEAICCKSKSIPNMGLHKRQTKILLSDWFFLLGVFLFPFDNLSFAPSYGWATISPFFFLIYLLLNINKILQLIKEKRLGIIIPILLFSLFIAFLNGITSEIIDTVGTMVLGGSFYLSLFVYFDKQKKMKIKLFYKIINIAYCISFIYGIVYLLQIDSIREIMYMVEKRYIVNRLQYTFTEPSFISMHIYGILLPVSLIGKNKKGILLSFLFILTTLLLGNSTRFIIDTVVIGFILIFNYLLKKKKYSSSFLLIIAILLMLLIVKKYDKSGRISGILNFGVYYDNSLAARWFRINATLKGFDFIHLITGYGLSNVSIPFNRGYNSALSEATNSWLNEILALKGSTSSSIFCFPVRLVAEFGLPLSLFFLYKMFSKKHIAYFLIIFYLYLQFDSYAFFALWLYLFFVKERNSNDFSYTSRL